MSDVFKPDQLGFNKESTAMKHPNQAEFGFLAEPQTATNGRWTWTLNVIILQVLLNRDARDLGFRLKSSDEQLKGQKKLQGREERSVNLEEHVCLQQRLLLLQ